jgi:bile acid:Na+ symporter, BASS family
MTGPIPDPLIFVTATVTMAVVMGGLGLGIAPRQLRWAWHRPGPALRALFAVLIVVPATAIVVSRLFGLPRVNEIGIVLMAISPGAPLALSRSIGASGHRALAANLQIAVATLAIVSMPLSLVVLNPLYSGHASISPLAVLKQVSILQLLPLGIGATIHWARPAFAARLEPKLQRVGGPLLLILALLVLVESWTAFRAAEPWTLAAMALVTLSALAAGHLLGGPEPSMRTAAAVSSALRNPGLALMVAQANSAVPEIESLVMVHLVVTSLASLPYFIWRRRAKRKAEGRLAAEAHTLELPPAPRIPSDP